MKVLDAFDISSVHPGVCCGEQNWHNQTSGSLITSINPANCQAIAQVTSGTAQDYELVMQSAQLAYQRWREVPAPQRGELVRRIGQALREHKDALGTLVSLEMGKIKQEGDGEVQEMIDMADFAVGQSRMLYGKTMHSERSRHRMYEQWHPLGVVGVVTAFNFPVAVWAWNAFIAAIAGNSVVWKPSPKTPLCAIAVQKICNQVMQEMGYAGIFSLFITDDVALSKAMVNDVRLPLLSFTGSTRVGREVAQVVAARMGRSLLELSGNNAVIVDASADLGLAIPAIVFGAVGTAGQRCTTTRRLFVHQSRMQEVMAMLSDAYRQVRVGDPLRADTLMGPLIDQAALASFEQVMTQLSGAANAQVVSGGARIESEGYYVQPTLVELTQPHPLMQQETFAPILYVMQYDKLEQAIELQNSVAQGLSSAIFSNDLRSAEQFLAAQGSDCGIANVNIGTSGAEIGGAFGGEKDTGGGREAGSDAWKAYMRRQTTTINWGSELPLAQGIKFQL